MERPILFSGPMVRALLDGRKTQTRRVVKPQPPTGAGDIEGHALYPDEWFYWLNGGDKSPSFHCPYGKPGNRLWVRETFAYLNTGYYDRPEMGHFFRADGERPDYVRRWRPSIHMPRELSRITLEIVSIRAERVQDVSEADAMAEGIVEQRVAVCDEPVYGLPEGRVLSGSAKEAYADLWNDINNPKGYCADDEPNGWGANPWVWVVEFRRIDQ